MNAFGEVVFVFVNYRDYTRIEALLQQQVPESSGVVIVDNTEVNLRDHEALERLRAIARVTVLEADNLGYLGAVAFALETLVGIENAEFLAVCKTDLDFSMANMAQYLLLNRARFAARGVGAIAPRLVGASGAVRRQLHLVEPPESEHMERLARLFSSYWVLAAHKTAGDIKRRLSARRAFNDRSLVDEQSIFAPHGALMVFTSGFMAIEDGFRFPCFLYGEEVFVGLQLREAGLRCIYVESITYSHEAHGSMGSWPSRAVAKHLQEAHAWAAQALEQASDSEQT